MSLLATAVFSLLVLSTSFLAGIFGMAGGLILMGGLLYLLEVSGAMILHGLTQAASNGWRATMWRQWINWPIVGRYSLGLIAAAMLFLSVRFIPDERVVLIMIGLLPLAGLVLPHNLSLRAEKPGQAEACGFVCTSLQLISGVSGPTLDLFFVRGTLDRRAVVATKAACQVVTHLAKTAYFGLMAGSTSTLTWPIFILAIGMAVLGTSLSRTVLDRMTDEGFRRYTRWIVAALSTYYLLKGTTGFVYP